MSNILATILILMLAIAVLITFTNQFRIRMLLMIIMLSSIILAFCLIYRGHYEGMKQYVYWNISQPMSRVLSALTTDALEKDFDGLTVKLYRLHDEWLGVESGESLPIDFADEILTLSVTVKARDGEPGIEIGQQAQEYLSGLFQGGFLKHEFFPYRLSISLPTREREIYHKYPLTLNMKGTLHSVPRRSYLFQLQLDSPDGQWDIINVFINTAYKYLHI